MTTIEFVGGPLDGRTETAKRTPQIYKIAAMPPLNPKPRVRKRVRPPFPEPGWLIIDRWHVYEFRPDAKYHYQGIQEP